MLTQCDLGSCKRPPRLDMVFTGGSTDEKFSLKTVLLTRENLLCMHACMMKDLYL